MAIEIVDFPMKNGKCVQCVNNFPMAVGFNPSIISAMGSSPLHLHVENHHPWGWELLDGDVYISSVAGLLEDKDFKKKAAS